MSSYTGGRGASGSRGGRGTKRGCAHFARTGRCRFGTECRFSHEPGAPISPPSTSTQSQARRRNWSHSLSGEDSIQPTQLAKTVTEAIQIIESGDPDAKQALIKELGDEIGLRWIVRVLDSNFSLEPNAYSLGFHEHCVPFLMLISHEEILTSLVLEKAVGTIYSVVYGVAGRRGIMFFRKCVGYLIQAPPVKTSGTEEEHAIFAITSALFNTINLNQDAVIQKEFNTITATLSQYLDGFPENRKGGYALRTASRNIQRIKERLHMAEAIPHFSVEVAATSFPEFQIAVDPPGDLSLKGARHDNDHASIENISILPTTDEIRANRMDFLPLKNKASPHHEDGILRLIDSQFRLLREDTSGQLRDAICGLVSSWDIIVRGKDKQKKVQHLRRMDAKMRIFENVAVRDLKLDRRKGMLIGVTFSQPQEVSGMRTGKDRAAWWENSRDLQYGSLVALVDDTLETTFLLVADREVKEAYNIEHDLAEYGVRKVNDLSGDPEMAFIPFTLVNPESELDLARMVAFAQQTTPGSAILVEFPGLLYASFHPILKCLQALHQKPNVPFANWLAPLAGVKYTKHGGLVDIPPPLYMARNNALDLDLTSITHDKYPLRFSIRQPVTVEELEQHTTLDRGQCVSLINSLKHELALIQGPPGTGKSYVGVQLVKILLANTERIKIGPIICVCYTNHALDQFLEHILDSGETKVIRLGSRSKSERLSALALSKVRRGTMATRVERQNVFHTQQSLDAIEIEMGRLLEECSHPCSHHDIADYLEVHFPAKHDILFASAKEVGAVDAEGFRLVGSRTKSDVFRNWLKGRSPPGRIILPRQTNRGLEQLLGEHDWWQTSLRERQTLKNHWEGVISDLRRRDLHAQMKEWCTKSSLLQMQYKEADRRCLEQANVIGCTTTGLATNSELLRSLPAKVLVCEEAAEVLEVHLVTALLPSVEHAILIGDHLQLRPQISKYELSMESEQGKKYGLDESLFERLAREDYDGAKIPISQLDIQRRMFPTIASLVRDTLYPDLRDHPSTAKYPEVVGMRRRLFWLDHRSPEDSGGSGDPLQTSKSNEFEANMVVSLVRHLSRQGVYRGQEDIAVITPYLGQLRKLRKKFSNTIELLIAEKDLEQIVLEGDEDEKEAIQADNSEVTQGRLLDGIRLATVDNFQGEEAKIIIVSLVRSNDQRKYGFLKTSNRINVLLSRAQHGMYIIGNSETYQGVPMWAKVTEMLEEGGNIGSELELQCPRHVDAQLYVSCPDDFPRVTPEGGCNQRCGVRLSSCGHVCIMACHSSALHKMVKCIEDCMRQYSHCEHSCPKRCWETCGDCRVRITTNITLPCGHTPTSLECWETVDLTKVKCKEFVIRPLPCGHSARMPCHSNPEDFRCKSLCGDLLPCGHQCSRLCSSCRKESKDQPNVIVKDHKTCVITCGRQYTTCNHSCSQHCHEGTPCKPCQLPCQIKCVHSKCPNKCFEACVPCAVQCSWSCKHRGSCNMPCSVPCDMIPCSIRCDKILGCGHVCPSICGEACPSKKYCQQCGSRDILNRVADLIMFTEYRDTDLDTDPIIFLSCGHFYTVQTLDGHMGLAEAYEVDAAGTIVGPKHFSRSNMKACPDCRAPLRNIHRYNRVVKSALLDEATKRFMSVAGGLHQALLEDVEGKEGKLEDLVNQLAHMSAEKNTPLASKSARISEFKRTSGEAMLAVKKFIDAVSAAEQPYGRVRSMVIDARRRRGVQTNFELDNTVIQHGFQLRGKSLQLRVVWAVLWNFKSMSQHMPQEIFDKDWKTFALPKLRQAMGDSLALTENAEAAGLVKQQIESLIYRAQFTALELSMGAPREESGATGAEKAKIVAIETNNLDKCLELITRNPSAAYLQEDVKKARILLTGGTFYSFVSSAEKMQVYAAMAREFRGTGHWYYCEQGHPFTVGECGMPMELARCSECGSPVGGTNHAPTAGVTRAGDLDGEFGRMAI